MSAWYNLNSIVDLQKGLIYDLSGSLTSDKVAYVGTTKNIIVVLDEFSQKLTCEYGLLFQALLVGDQLAIDPNAMHPSG